VDAVEAFSLNVGEIAVAGATPEALRKEPRGKLVRSGDPGGDGARTI
jgi:hypothetical protein